MTNTNEHAGALMAICKEYHDRVMELEGQKWDLERSCKIKVLEVIKDLASCFGLRIHC